MGIFSCTLNFSKWGKQYNNNNSGFLWGGQRDGEFKFIFKTISVILIVTPCASTYFKKLSNQLNWWALGTQIQSLRAKTAQLLNRFRKPYVDSSSVNVKATWTVLLGWWPDLWMDVLGDTHTLCVLCLFGQRGRSGQKKPRFRSSTSSEGRGISWSF